MHNKGRLKYFFIFFLEGILRKNKKFSELSFSSSALKIRQKRERTALMANLPVPDAAGLRTQNGPPKYSTALSEVQYWTVSEIRRKFVTKSSKRSKFETRLVYSMTKFAILSQGKTENITLWWSRQSVKLSWTKSGNFSENLGVGFGIGFPVIRYLE